MNWVTQKVWRENVNSTLIKQTKFHCNLSKVMKVVHSIYLLTQIKHLTIWWLLTNFQIRQQRRYSRLVNRKWKIINLLGFFNHSELMYWHKPHGLEDDTDVVPDTELIIELVTWSCCLNVWIYKKTSANSIKTRLSLQKLSILDHMVYKLHAVSRKIPSERILIMIPSKTTLMFIS